MLLLETRLARPGEYPFKLKMVRNPETVQYTILSHTWGDDEVLYEDVIHRTGETKEGFAKAQGALQLARDDGYDYLWIDSMCIDKSSSAELQEAINSMYAWYKSAAVCYAHLSDVHFSCSSPGVNHNFAESRWFKRGWTLQELIAPRTIRFFDASWTLIGDKLQLLDALSKVTRINQGVLSDAKYVAFACAAEKMSWAARRETTRGEDRAYSLMGLFGVNMPMLYGEGSVNAFLRLQEEIMRRSDDHSLFAWCDEQATDMQLRGLLATSPSVFNFEGVDRIRWD